MYVRCVGGKGKPMYGSGLYISVFVCTDMYVMYCTYSVQ